MPNFKDFMKDFLTIKIIFKFLNNIIQEVKNIALTIKHINTFNKIIYC